MVKKTSLLPLEGEMDTVTHQPKKIHLVGHSLGGQTIRVLSQLLATAAV
ncbi:hypothetical protein [Laceyella putida]|uniref:Lipase-like C-terminal domain-containing protein n=1 Tax=Laceyella putida TaxID=110101 RepID=A0ABW2RL46_9BACL